MRKVILTIDYNDNLVDDAGLIIWSGASSLLVRDAPSEGDTGTGIGGEQAIRMMKMAAYISDPDKTKEI